MDLGPGTDLITASLSANAREISKRELVRYVLRTPQSEKAMARAERVLPLGVASVSGSSCATHPATFDSGRQLP